MTTHHPPMATGTTVRVAITSPKISAEAIARSIIRRWGYAKLAYSAWRDALTVKQNLLLAVPALFNSAANAISNQSH